MRKSCSSNQTNENMDEQQIADMVKKEVSLWFKSQEGQTSGYDYEKTFIAVRNNLYLAKKVPVPVDFTGMFSVFQKVSPPCFSRCVEN